MHIVSFNVITEYVSLDSMAPTDHLVVKMKYCYSSFIRGSLFVYYKRSRSASVCYHFRNLKSACTYKVASYSCNIQLVAIAVTYS